MAANDFPIWQRWLRGALFVLIVAAAAALQAATATVHVRADNRYKVLLSVLVVSVIVGLVAAHVTAVAERRRAALVGALLLAAGFGMLGGSLGPGAAVLAERGTQVEATITAVRVTSGRWGDQAHYTLKGIPGEWTDKNTKHARGSKVTVVVDPKRLVHPGSPDDVASAWLFWLVAALLFLPAALLGLAAGGPLGFATRPRTRSRR